MISKARIKWIKSLELRKYRLQHHAFVAEGPKLVGELLPHFVPIYVAATKAWLNENRRLLAHIEAIDEVSDDELKRASLLRTPQDVVAIMPIPDRKLDVSLLRDSLVLALDGVQDPGNLGTILRIADWFGIRHVICSEGTTDVYGPKCVQACMGALARVDVHYCQLPQLIAEARMPVLGTFLDGTDIYRTELPPSGILVMGNEGNGISPEVSGMATHRLFIPSYPRGAETTESLNVAIATGIVCAELRRRMGC